ncbi:hypothetical protein BS47DRAFT_1354532 [Hydnum rufescens UP504]|uniref:Secreted protein n=1 Tax=Hydnum rufescens UP504 TaxID=1448309 RepID=A0A9P6DK73_9AGAM|nr:hypothetical protein BS47DRAFT_1354532 [Hydnum rufescens UP504]
MGLTRKTATTCLVLWVLRSSVIPLPPAPCYVPMHQIVLPISYNAVPVSSNWLFSGYCPWLGSGSVWCPLREGDF